MMDRIARTVEKDVSYPRIMDAEHPDTLSENPSDSITAAAWRVAKDVRAKVIVNYTTSGSTALRTARQRPDMPVLCLTERLRVARRLMLSYGIHAAHTQSVTGFDDMVEKAASIAKNHGLAQRGERMVITAGVPFGTPGSTNVLRIAWVE
jgi:pyruvate kinase